MKKPLSFFVLLLMLLSARSWAGDGDKALMLTVFGASTEASATFDELLPLARKRFPDRTVVMPYTSGIIRDKVNAAITNPEKKILSPAQMLEKLKADGYRDIAVVSTILFAGVEHDKLKSTVDAFASANKDITVRYVPPLLADRANLQPVINTLGNSILKDGSNVVVAHGTRAGHSVEKAYLELAELVAATYPNARAGSVAGVPNMGAVLDWVKNSDYKNVRFIVFMFVAGDHAENDIASDKEDSLFSTVRGMGKTPSVVYVNTTAGKRMASLGLDSDYRAILLEHYAGYVR
jgi:sirohydrochlorin cobaltochelatase